MPCREWKNEWIAQLYDELEPGEAKRLEAHTATCADCRETLRVLAGSREILRDSAPAIPPVPRVVVLEPKRPWLLAWAFAAGAASAALVFGLGLFARPSPTPFESTALPAVVPASAELERLEGELRTFQARLADVEARPANASRTVPEDTLLTRAQFREEIQRVELRFDRERAHDLEYLLECMSATELRTGTWIDQTQEALNYLAMRQDPRTTER